MSFNWLLRVFTFDFVIDLRSCLFWCFRQIRPRNCQLRTAICLRAWSYAHCSRDPQSQHENPFGDDRFVGTNAGSSFAQTGSVSAEGYRRIGNPQTIVLIYAIRRPSGCPRGCGFCARRSCQTTSFDGNSHQGYFNNIKYQIVKVIKSSFLTQCVRHIDYEALEKMTPDIVELIKSTVNLGTKIACAHFICLVSLNLN